LVERPEIAAMTRADNVHAVNTCASSAGFAVVCRSAYRGWWWYYTNEGAPVS
jgi:hypothetical protein